ncbi:MAG TPA: urea ABC transporter ATP-binding protein UrtD [Candidatus Kryptonia bacterium]|nr:urea ABC transporter ATP-binding protein UrtD [Candidatus Kryptonia bacterium]
MAEDIIRTENLSVTFDGFRALNKLNFSMQRGELRVVIGPNGAGKTTLLDAICGKVTPSEGRVLFQGKDLRGLREYEIVHRGVGRKFQTPSIYRDHTVFENLELSYKAKKTVFSTLFAQRSRTVREQIYRILDLVGLQDKIDQRAGALSHGEKQWLEIGMVIVQDPDLLLIDEPVAGMTDDESAKTGELLTSIAQDQAILVIEHDMAFVRQIAQTVTVLHEGALLFEGPVEQVQRHPRVVEIYLGREKGDRAHA